VTKPPSPFKPVNAEEPLALSLHSRSMRWMLLTPLLAVIALAALMGATVWYLTETEESQREQALIRDVDSAQRTIRERLKASEDDLAAFARDFGASPSAASLRRFSESFFVRRQEIIFLAWVDRSGIVRGVNTSQAIPSVTFDPINSPLAQSARKAAFKNATGSRQVNYSAPIRLADADVLVDLQVPIVKGQRTDGVLIATYSLPSLLLYAIPQDLAPRVAFSLLDKAGQSLAQTRSLSLIQGKPFTETPLEPMSRDITLRGYSYLPASSFYNDIMTTLIAGLISLAVISQILIWRNTRRRLGAESELAEETAFRRAMENSMSTGMRVIDLEGTITYVNPAFCRMVGFTFEELVGCKAPFPYWPDSASEQHGLNLERMLRGQSPPSGLPIPIMRKDKSELTVRMYTSPLIDHTGKQTGWMSSITDISEQTRIRRELAQAQERFITVLQALDAAVSVAPPAPQDDLLFANQAYKKWFGNSLENGHRFFANTAQGPWSDVREVYSPVVQRWFEVRIRSIQWVDGRVVELAVATDITQERASEQAQREQHEKLQQTSRLITMGEMASSLAHELNQPLTAITNYTSGAASRSKLSVRRQETPPIDELIELLEKTARQAERAGQVIRRIRGFVKRSDPIRKAVKATTIVADAVGLAEIDARERNLTIAPELDPDLPLLHVDPILIEQVLLNLIKNGLEAMKESSYRVLRVRVRVIDQQMQFSVIDRGYGVPAAIRSRLFDSFYTTKDDGMGMGLNICRSIIESHQGRLWFDDNPEGGCSFRFTLPLSPPPGPTST
jgi:PAS domain S-box-containing protein